MTTLSTTDAAIDTRSSHLKGKLDTFTVKSACVHQSTGELVLLTTMGDIIVCAQDENNSSVLSLSYLSKLNCDQPTVSAIKSIVAARHVLCATTTDNRCLFFDLTCGLLVSSLPLPSGGGNSGGGCAPAFWGLAPGDPTTQCGVWCEGALLQIVWPNPTAYSDALVAYARTKKQGSDAAALAAVEMCADWGLDQWTAQNAFDLLLRGVPCESIVEIAKALVVRLQNPALVVALLANRNMPG